MALIDEYIRQIRNAIYGKDVRAAIANGIQQCYTDISDSVDRANTAAANADTKANLANSKAAAADAAASTAYQNASSANTAAINANSAAAKLNGMTAAATLLPSGSSPTAQVSEVSGHKHISFGIPKGDKGDTGAKGKDFHIAKTFASIAEMNAYTGSVSLYDYAMIDTGNVEDADTGKLFCYEEDEKWHYIGDLSGAQGIKGETGTGISSVVLNDNYTLTINYTDGRSVTTASIRGDTGATGKGISDIRINDDNSVTILLDDGSEYTTEPVLGPQGETGPQGERGPQGESGPGIERVQMNSDYTLTIFLANGTDYTTPFAIQGSKGETGTGIDHIALNADYTLTIYFDDGTSYTTGSIRGATGITPNFTIGTVSTLNPDQDASVSITGTPENPVLNLEIPKGDTGSADNIYGTTVPISENDSRSIKQVMDTKLENVPVMTGATATDPGSSGLTPVPVAGDQNKFLKANGSWENVPFPPVMDGATASDSGTSGLVPAPAAGDATRYLRSDGTWAVPPDTHAPVDTALDSTSTNPVQNRVVASAISEVDNKLISQNNPCSDLSAIKSYLLSVANAMSEGETRLVMFRPAGAFDTFKEARYSGFLTLQTVASEGRYFEAIVSSSLSDVISFGYYGGAWNISAISDYIANLKEGILQVSSADDAPLGLSFIAGSGANTPFPFWATLHTVKGNLSSYLQQIAYPWASGENRLAYRVKDSDVWENWHYYNDGSDVGIVENGAIATHGIAAGQYVIWKGVLYKANSPIPVGDDLATNLTVVSNGLGGEVAALNSKLTTVQLFKKITVTTTTSATGNANITQLQASEVVVAVHPPVGAACAFIGRGNNGAYYVHVTDSSGNPITNASVELDIYYVDP